MTAPAALSRPLRVALVITELNVGGAERCATNLALGLDRELFEPIVVSLAPRPIREKSELVERLEAAAIPTHFLGLCSPREFLKGRKLLQQLFTETAPDVVQTFLVHANVLGAVAAQWAGVRNVATGVRVADPRRRRLWLERFAASRARCVVCVSQAAADVITRRGKIPAKKIVVIPNGIDVRRFESVEAINLGSLGIDPGRRIIAVVGRLEKQKGVDWLLSLAPQLLHETPQHDLLFVGDGPQRNELSSSVAEMGLAGRVHFAGWRADVPAILAASDLLLLPSRWEGMPNVVLEAMASRRPVVATQSEGVCELLGEASQAQTVSCGDSQVFVEKVLAIILDDEISAQLGEENRRRAEECFSLRTMIEHYQDLFGQLAGRDFVK
jgi:glycosyltransferase involved in cell wall biosynthesis